MEHLTRMTTSPSAVNFTALEPRLSSTCRIRVPSPSSAAGTSGWTSTSSSSPLPWAVPARMRPTSSTTPGTSTVGLLELELARLDLGEVQDVVDDDEQALGRDLHARGELVLLVVEARSASSSSVSPITPFIGVRISWLIVDRNSDLVFDATAPRRGPRPGPRPPGGPR